MNTGNRDPLQEAFQDLSDTAPSRPESEEIEPELVWQAIAGELPAAQRRELVERVAEDPATAESWRLAQELFTASQARGLDSSEGSGTEPLPWRRFIAAAAAIVVVAFLGQVVLRQWSPSGEAPVYREAGLLTVGTDLPDRATLPRIAARLSWSLGGMPADTDTSEVRYTLRVFLPDLTPLATARDLATPEYQLPVESLLDLPAGQELLWQVDAHLPEGGVISSETFVVHIQ